MDRASILRDLRRCEERKVPLKERLDEVVWLRAELEAYYLGTVNSSDLEFIVSTINRLDEVYVELLNEKINMEFLYN